MANSGGIFLAGLVIGALAGGGAVYLTNANVAPNSATSTTLAKQDGTAIPDAATAQELALNTTLRFGEAINNRDLAGFRATTTEEFQQAFSLPAFEAAFAGFIQQRTNLLAVTGMRPVLTTRAPGAQAGSLHLAGWFPTQPSRLSFDYQYTREGPDWRLNGIDVKVQPQ